MSSALAQTLIGGGLAILGGLIAAWWQSSRSDNVAQQIRRAERYESALIELNALVAKVDSQVGKVWQDGRSVVLRGLSQEGIDASEYGRARDPLNELLNHWQSVSSLLISDSGIVEAFVRLYQETATHIWHEENLAYSRLPPQHGKIDTTQSLQDLESVYLAVAEVRTQVRSRVAALHDGPHQQFLGHVKALSRAAKRKSS